MGGGARAGMHFRIKVLKGSGFNEKVVRAVGVDNDNEGDGGSEGGEESRAWSFFLPPPHPTSLLLIGGS